MHEKELETAKQAALQAAAATMKLYKSELEVAHKEDESPITQADKQSHQIITTLLEKNFPQDAIVSEEGIIGPDREQAARVWIVDPLDGTKEFINQTDEFTVNIALIVEHRPVLGVIAVPAKNELYWAIDGEGSYQERGGESLELAVSETSRMSEATAVGSRSHAKPQLKAILDQLGVEKQVPAGSSLKGCMIAGGEADIYLRLQGYYDWDVAAMDLIVQEAGGITCGLDGEELQYNTQSLLKQGLIACTPLLLERILEQVD